MMKDNGGSAFPLPLGSETASGADGMTLRDYFAAKAMAAIVDVMHSPELFANHAYKVADAMIEARKK